MKIIFIIDTLFTNLAGTENQLLKIINGLDKRRFEVQLICLKKDTWFQEHNHLIGCSSLVIEICKFKRPITYVNILKLVSFLMLNKPDIVHTFFPVSNIVGVLAARLAGIRNIVSSRRDYGEWMVGSYLSATKFANKFVKKIIANSIQVKKLTLKREGADSSLVDVICNGIDAESFKGLKRDFRLGKSLNISEGTKIVGIIANFRPMKHHYIFIMAANEILKKRKDIDFLLVGEGVTRSEMEKLSESLGINSHMHFVGRQKDVISYLSIMDVGVNCSEREGLCNAVMEYICAGIPCVVSNAGGNTDLITHNEDGYIFELDDYKMLASLIVDIIDDEVKRKIFTDNALEKIEKSMGLKSMVTTYENYYHNLIYGRN